MVSVTSPARLDTERMDAERATARQLALVKLFEPKDEAAFERDKIRHEDEVLNHRLSWLTTSAAIFVTAYVIGFADGNGMPTLVRLGIPLLALSTCLQFHVGIKAAIDASQDIETHWNEWHPEYPDVLLGGTPETRDRGLRAARFVAPTFVLAWVVALGYEVSQLL
jgi:hypothetical protein